MSFPFGRAILAMLVCSLLSGLFIMSRKAMPKAALVMWVSADSHARMYREGMLDDFRNRSGESVRLDQIAPAALDVRLLSLFMFSADHSVADRSLPDVVEVEIGSIGKYFRPPVDEVGFLPLNRYLDRDRWRERIVASRLTPWTKDGVIFGVPHDLHPCTLSYRKDLFDEAGVDLSSVTTWAQLQEVGLRFQEYWAGRGQKRWAMGLSSTSPDNLLVMLRQQRVQLIDADLSVHLSDERVVKTLAWYVRAVAGERQIGMTVAAAPGQTARDFASGELCALITPDWLIADLKQFAPDLNGKVAMIPLPRFAGGDARTASWGGTMIGITRSCSDPDRAWDLIESLYLDRRNLEARQRATGIIPPIREFWSDPAYHQPEPFYGGQKVDELYIQLADELPATAMTPYTIAAQTYFSIVLNRAVGHVNDADLEHECRKWLGDAQGELDRMVRFDSGKG